MQKMQEKQKAFVLNPAIGPEGLSGSSRMKGGSATKILLETLLLAAHKTVDQGIAASQRCLLEILRTFERAHQVTYSQSPKIATLMKSISTSLEKKGHVYLVGWQTLGIIAIMDGVECIHTFGAGGTPVQMFFLLPPDPNHSGCSPNTVLLPTHGCSSVSHLPYLNRHFSQILLP
ncbi:glucokinase regulatory protein-like [Hylobates moloch]|uniref:glucokinase regulatory protein-like n=1 Tax=Hylobates moloch TaxID=81572 RepID=UPI001362B741|nr:glucokinase regulatory protein-like [Hylobates moloch]